jgi:hypothetical protein
VADVASIPQFAGPRAWGGGRALIDAATAVLCERATAVKSWGSVGRCGLASHGLVARSVELPSGSRGRAQGPLDLDRQSDPELDERKQQRLREVELKAVGFVHLQQALDRAALVGELAPKGGRAFHLQ